LCNGSYRSFFARHHGDHCRYLAVVALLFQLLLQKNTAIYLVHAWEVNGVTVRIITINLSPLARLSVVARQITWWRPPCQNQAQINLQWKCKALFLDSLKIEDYNTLALQKFALIYEHATDRNVHLAMVSAALHVVARDER
jgi:hypothetical protein